MTLVELLVVIMIVGILAAVTLPVMVPMLDSRRIRESSRMVTAYLHGARDAAMRNGRPVGVMFERYTDPGGSGGGDLRMCLVLRQVEVPPPYAGDMLMSRASVALNTSTNFLEINGFPTGDSSWQNVIRVGDSVRFNHQGHLYQITGPGNPGDYLTQAPSATPWVLAAPPGVTVPSSLAAGAIVPFQIMRQPVQSSAPPLQLPEGVVIDLRWSGMSTFNSFDNAFAPIVTFSPDGSIDAVYGDTMLAATAMKPRPTAPIHLLLGKRERIGADHTEVMPEAWPNWRDLENLWISLFPSTGLIASSEMADVGSAATFATLGDAEDAVIRSRAFALSGKGMGGR